MPVISVRIPQMGEGLQEALLVEFLKKPGDEITRDEPIYVMETDKATTDVESPYDGKLVEWTADPGSVLPIGSEVGKMEVAAGVKEMPANPHQDPTEIAEELEESSIEKNESSPPRRPRVIIPPRTKKYLKEKRLLEVADQIPIAGKKMMPGDVDRYLENRGEARAFTPQESPQFVDTELPKAQITLNYRLVRGVKSTVPVTVMQTVNWEAVHQAREELKTRSQTGTKTPTGFNMLTWCVVQSIMKFPRFRSNLVGDGKYIRTHKNVNLGIAVGLPGDELVTAVVPKANQLSMTDYCEMASQQIELARKGQDQADSSVTFSVSNIGSTGLRWGIPAIVLPAVATLVVGEAYDYPVPDGDSFRFQKSIDLTLSFDHRLLNGVGGAEFMNDLRQRIESFQLK